MELEGSLPCLQQPAIGPCSGPDEFSPAKLIFAPVTKHQFM